MKMKPRFERIGPKRIAGLRGQFTQVSLHEIPALWGRLVSSGKVPCRTSTIDYAVVLLLPDCCDYLAGFEVDESAVLPEGLACTEIPASEYAVFAHDGHVSTLCKTFDSAVNHWLPASDFEIGRAGRGRPYVLERYGERFDPVAGSGDLELWVPVSRRAAA